MKNSFQSRGKFAEVLLTLFPLSGPGEMLGFYCWYLKLKTTHESRKNWQDVVQEYDPGLSGQSYFS